MISRYLMSQSHWSFAVAALLLTNSCSRRVAETPPTARPAVQETLIKAGEGIGPLRLGDTRERTLAIFPRKNTDAEYDFSHCGPRKEIHWFDLELKRSGVFVYLRDGRVFQIESSTPRFRTPEGITEDSDPSVVQRYYTLPEAYVLKGSGGIEVGGRDLVYWVNQETGIAFEFHFNPKKSRRLLGKTIVFAAGSKFAPQGCIVPPQEWHRLPPYALEP